ncbi:MAG: hypothetical protein J7J54_03455 [Candidatus Omnitrophica bacterium]|nr:hypothetical protein [Candidatus Omnitrophota bacterium]
MKRGLVVVLLMCGVAVSCWGLLLEGDLSSQDGMLPPGSESQEISQPQEIRGIEPDPGSVLQDLSAIGFENQELVEAAVSQLQKISERTGISMERLLDVINGFDFYLNANSSGFVAKGLQQLEFVKEPVIAIQDEGDAVDFANLMGDLAQKIGDADPMNHLVMQNYTLGLGTIAYKHPEFRGTNTLLGALDLVIHRPEFEKVIGKNDVDIYSPYEGLVVQLGDYLRTKEDWENVSAVLKGLDPALKELGVKAVVESYEELDGFAELVSAMGTYYSYLPKPRCLCPELWQKIAKGAWKEILQKALAQGITDFREIARKVVPTITIH